MRELPKAKNAQELSKNMEAGVGKDIPKRHPVGPNKASKGPRLVPEKAAKSTPAIVSGPVPKPCRLHVEIKTDTCNASAGESSQLNSDNNMGQHMGDLDLDLPERLPEGGEASSPLRSTFPSDHCHKQSNPILIHQSRQPAQVVSSTKDVHLISPGAAVIGSKTAGLSDSHEAIPPDQIDKADALKDLVQRLEGRAQRVASDMKLEHAMKMKESKQRLSATGVSTEGGADKDFGINDTGRPDGQPMPSMNHACMQKQPSYSSRKKDLKANSTKKSVADSAFLRCSPHKAKKQVKTASDGSPKESLSPSIHTSHARPSLGATNICWSDINSGRPGGEVISCEVESQQQGSFEPCLPFIGIQHAAESFFGPDSRVPSSRQVNYPCTAT